MPLLAALAKLNYMDFKFFKQLDNKVLDCQHSAAPKGIMIIIEVYVDDIIFGGDDDKLSQQFSKDM